MAEVTQDARHMALPPGLDWRRVHPITPLLTGWKLIAGILALFSIQNLDNVLDLYRALRAADLDLAAVSSRALWLSGGGLVALIVIGTVVLVAQWRARTFAVDGAGVYQRSGVLAKQLRIARLPRIQSVDIVHPLLGRVFGLGQLVVEVAGGADSHVIIGYLRTGELEDLRDRILDLAAGAVTEPPSAGGDGEAGGAHAAARALELAGTRAMPTGADAATGRAGGTEAAGEGVEGAEAEGAQAEGAQARPDRAGGSTTLASGTPAQALPLGFEDVAAPPSREEQARMRAAQQRMARPEETPLFEVDPHVLLGSILRSVLLWVYVVILVAIVVLIGVGVSRALPREESLESFLGAVLPGAAVVLAGVSALWSRFRDGWGFRAAATPAGIRLRHGLTSTVSSTLPPGRVHAVTLTQGPLWRSKDWWKVEVTVAGKSAGESTGAGDSDSSDVLLPVGDRDTALRALWLVVPDLGVSDPGAVLAAALAGLDDDGVGDVHAPVGSPERGFVRVSPRARLFTPLGLRRSAVLASGTCLIVRRGRIWRSVLIVPYARIQSFSVSQGPWARRRGLAGYDLDLVEATPGAALNNFEAADVAALREVLACRSLRAAHAEHLDRWLARALEDAAARGERRRRETIGP